MNSLRFGELDSPRVRYLFEQAVAGIAGYGNAIGVPTVGGEIQFDPCYEQNPLVNAMGVGLINHEDIQKGQAKGSAIRLCMLVQQRGEMAFMVQHFLLQNYQKMRMKKEQLFKQEIHLQKKY